MGPVANFIIALTVGVTSLVGGSLVWPRLTTQERPRLLQEVHDKAIGTSLGQRAAAVLGVGDETNIQPISLGGVVYSLIDSAKAVVQKRAQTVIVGNAVNQLRSQFDKLSPDQKEQIQQALCNPTGNSDASASSETR